jgi:hypothetical protein
MNINVGQSVWVVVPGDRFSGRVESVASDRVVVDDGVGTTWEVAARGSGGMWLEDGRREVIYGSPDKAGRAWQERVDESRSIRPDYNRFE